MSVLSAAGSGQTPLLLVLDGPHKETEDLAEVLGIPYVIHTPQGERGEWALTEVLGIP